MEFPIQVSLLMHNASFAHMLVDSLLLLFSSVILLSLLCYVRKTQNGSLYVI